MRSDDSKLLAVADGDANLLVLARELLEQNLPGPLGGGTTGTESTEWIRDLNEAAVPAFKDIATIDDYISAQENLIERDRDRFQKRSRSSQTTQSPTPGNPVAGSDTNPLKVFVIMPFTEPWSDTTYSHIRESVEELGDPAGIMDVYRADDISKQGSITGQIKDAISNADVVIADITGVNPNVMWELGYADGLGKSIVILNQRPDDSPFDMVDRRQVKYGPQPTKDDQSQLVRHIRDALRSAFGESPPAWMADPG